MDQVGPVVAMNAAGQFVIGWVSDHNVIHDANDTEKSIFVRWYDASGAALDAEFLVHEYTKDAQEHPALGMDALGNFVVAWQSINQEMNEEGEGTSWGVYARQFEVDVLAGTITPRQDEFRVNVTVEGPQRYPSIGVDRAGYFVVTWQSIRQDASSWAVLARQYRPNGTAEGDEALVNTWTSGPQILPVVAERGTGDFDIFWLGQGPDHVEGVHGRWFHFIRDNFNRHIPSLGPDWTVRQGDYDLHDQVAVVQSTGVALATLNGVSLKDVSVEGQVVLSGGLKQTHGLVARYRNQKNMYWATLVGQEGAFQAQIWRRVKGVWKLLSSASVAEGTGLLRFEVVGRSLKLFVNNELVTFVFDNKLTKPGMIGMRGNWESILDNLTYAELKLVPGTLPFRDSFNLSDGSQLDRFWIGRKGNYGVLNHQARGSGKLSLADLNGPQLANVAVEADVDVTLGGAAGLVARHNGAKDTNMYWGTLANRNGVFYAEIWRNLSGTWTRLARTEVGTGAGQLRFEAIGKTLNLYLDGNLVISAKDGALATGSIGIRSSGAASFDNFLADAS
jgi:hypothetical protein